jgi:hypothetical protein
MLDFWSLVKCYAVLYRQHSCNTRVDSEEGKLLVLLLLYHRPRFPFFLHFGVLTSYRVSLLAF